ncbi:hypothetical protein D9M68_821830 [compost metagenome]
MLAGEQGVAALFRQLLGQQHGAQAGELLVGQVRVPELAGIAQADWLTVLDDVGDDEDFRVAGQQELLEHMDLQRAEAATEGDLLLGGDALVTEDQQGVIQMGAMDASEVGIAQGTGQVQADDFGTQWCVEGTDVERLGRRLATGLGCCRHRKLHAKAPIGASL